MWKSKCKRELETQKKIAEELKRDNRTLHRQHIEDCSRCDDAILEIKLLNERLEDVNEVRDQYCREYFRYRKILIDILELADLPELRAALDEKGL